MTLFHVSNHSTVPKLGIPFTAGTEEDKTVARICFAESIEACILALSNDTREELLYQGSFWVWTVNAEDYQCWDYNKLWNEALVPDALETHEWWLLEDLLIKDARPIKYNLINCSLEMRTLFKVTTPEQIYQYMSKIENEKFGQELDELYLKFGLERLYDPENSEDFYEEVMELASSDYNLQDQICDTYVEIPWVQGHKFTMFTIVPVKEEIQPIQVFD